MNLRKVLNSNGEAQILSLIVKEGVLIHTELHGERSSIILISEFDRLINPEKEVSFTMFDRPFTIHFLARLNPFDERKLPLPNGCENRFTKHREAKFLFGANSFSNSVYCDPFRFQHLQYINNIIKNGRE